VRNQLKTTYIYAWGNGGDGRLGNGTQSNQTVPTKVHHIKNIKQIAAGDSHMLALTENGTVYAWGKGTSGQLGVENYDDYLEPVRIKTLPKIKFISCGDFSSAAISEEGSVYSWGWGGRYHNSIPIGMGTLALQSTKKINKPTKIAELQKVVTISLGKRHAGCVTEDGETYFWGRGDWGRLGTGNNSSQKFPFKLENLFTTTQKISVASNFSGMITTENDIYTWGKNDRNQLGYESTGNLVGGNQFDGSATPTFLNVEENGKTVKFKDLALGESICAACSIDGDGWMWGGTLQVPTKRDQLKNIVSVSGGSNHLAFVSGTGELFAVGSNWNGQLGVTGKKVQNQDIYKVPIDKFVKAVACGSNFTAAIVEE
jgi:alpha-tubulin suppressor-like RCC1 family protein